MGHFNNLSPAELERLAFLQEEMGEVSQIIGKILRHGYENYNPSEPVNVRKNNRRLLEYELGHVQAAITMMQRNKDLSSSKIKGSLNDKLHSVKKWMHHQD